MKRCANEDGTESGFGNCSNDGVLRQEGREEGAGENQQEHVMIKAHGILSMVRVKGEDFRLRTS